MEHPKSLPHVGSLLHSGGPVHPTPALFNIGEQAFETVVPGLTVRQYAAIHLGAGMLANSSLDETQRYWAEEAIRLTDLLLSELDKPTTPPAARRP